MICDICGIELNKKILLMRPKESDIEIMTRHLYIQLRDKMFDDLNTIGALPIWAKKEDHSPESLWDEAVRTMTEEKEIKEVKK